MKDDGADRFADDPWRRAEFKIEEVGSAYTGCLTQAGTEVHMDKEFLVAEITAAMRAQDKPRLSILRLVKDEVDQREKESHTALPPEGVTAALKKVLKQTGETLDGSIKAGTNAERTALLQQYVDILTAYLPAQVCGADLEAVVERVVAAGGFSGKREMGAAIAAVVAETGGNCDKAEVAKLVGARLQ